MSDLTPAEQQFFATGELPAELGGTTAPETPEHDLSALDSGTSTPPPAPAPMPEAATSPAPAPNPPSSESMLEILNQRLEALQAESAQLRQQLTQTQQPQNQPEPVPDPSIDPLGHMMHQINQVAGTVAKLQEQIVSQQTKQQQLQTFQQFQEQVHALRDEFVKTTPDFKDAYNHLRNARMADLRDAGLNDQQAQQVLLQDEYAVTQAAINQGKNPAAAVYEMARRHGYTKAAQAPTAPPPTAAEKVAAAAQAQAGSVSLPKTAPTADEFTLEGLKEASEADLNKLVLDPKAWAKIAGTSTDDIFLR